MPRSNFSNFKDGVTIAGLGLDVYSHGKHIYVCNSSVTTPLGLGGSDSNNGKTPDQPVATISKAIALCTAGAGDVVVVMPGHAEAISSATALTIDKSGVTIVGVGNGNSRPVITLDTIVSATINVTASNVTISNLIFTANFADVVSFFTLTTATDFKLDGCSFRATAVNMNCLYVVDTGTTANSADGLSIVNCDWYDLDAANVSLVKQDCALNRVRINNNYVHLGVNNSKPSLITQATGKANTNLECGNNKIYRLVTTNAGMILTSDSTNTGVIYNNYAQGADATNNLMTSASSGYGFFNNQYSGAVDASGFLNPAADS